jgi:hypothetical protein
MASAAKHTRRDNHLAGLARKPGVDAGVGRRHLIVTQVVETPDIQKRIIAMGGYCLKRSNNVALGGQSIDTSIRDRRTIPHEDCQTPDTQLFSHH